MNFAQCHPHKHAMVNRNKTGINFPRALPIRPGVKYVFVFDSFHTTYLNYIEIRAYLYLIEKSVFVFAFLKKKCIWPQPCFQWSCFLRLTSFSFYMLTQFCSLWHVHRLVIKSNTLMCYKVEVLFKFRFREEKNYDVKTTSRCHFDGIMTL